MEAMQLETSTFNVSIPTIDTLKFKQLIKLMGWSITPSKVRANLYDPETGEYVNEKTMQVIEQARKGKGLAFRGSVEDFKQWAEAV